MGQIFSYIDRFARVYHSSDLFPPGFVFSARDRPYMRMYSILSGSCTFYVDGTAYRAGAGDILLFDSGEVCHQVVEQPVDFHRIVVNFYPEIVSSFDPEQKLFRPFLLSEHRGRHLLHTGSFPDYPWRAAVMQIVEPQESPRLNIYTSFFRLCIAISAAFYDDASSAPATKFDPLVQETLQYLNDHLTEPMTTDILTRAMKISSSSLYSRFTASVGISIHQYVTIKRMSLARTMLADGIPAQEVCARCGYTEYSTFFRAFQRQFGFSPGETERHKEDRFY